MQDYLVDRWRTLLTRPKDDGVPKGHASNVLNWLIFKDRIELRGGMELLGNEQDGLGKITGMKVGKQINGEEKLVITHGKKVKYYNETSKLFIEITDEYLNNDMLGVLADGEEISIEEYQSLAGAFFYLSTPNGTVLKLPIATPSIIIDLESNNHRGYIKIKKGATFLFNRKDTKKGSDTTGLYRSIIDRDELSDYTEVINEVIDAGDGIEKNFIGNIALDIKNTCHYLRITDTVEIFTDDRNGNLVGDKGGTGTINYANGAYNITFNTAPANSQNITADYYIERSTDGGIFDFSKDTPRKAGQSVVFRQDDGGGAFKNIGSIAGSEYCFHEKNIYKLDISDDDASASNIIYRNNVGIQNFRSMVETDEGIFFIDSANKADPQIRLLKPGYNNPNAIPGSISEMLDLSEYNFDEGGIGKWNIYIVVWGKLNSNINNRMLLYNRIDKTWTITDYRANVIDSLNGSLIAGDSGSNNVIKLLTGITDDEANIENFFETGNDYMGKKDNNLGTERFHRFVINGLIQKTQNFDIYFSYDNAKYINVGTVLGNGSYVDLGTKISVGNNTVGSKEVGGSNIIVSPYMASIKVHTPKFERLKIKFIATNIGYISIHSYECKDRRQKGRRVPIKYIQ